VHLVDEKARPHTRVSPHDAVHVLGTGVEDPDSAEVAAIDDRTHDRHDPCGAQRDVALAVPPHDVSRGGARLQALLREGRTALQDEQCVGARRSDVRRERLVAGSLWNPATGQFDPLRLLLAIVVRGWTPDDFAREAECGRTSVYKALQGKGVRDATAIAIFRTLARREPRLPLAG
jgi:hypothetical protein